MIARQNFADFLKVHAQPAEDFRRLRPMIGVKDYSDFSARAFAKV